MDSDQQSALIRASLIFIGCATAAVLFVYITKYYPIVTLIVFILGWLAGIFYLIYSWTLFNIKRNRRIAEQEAKRVNSDSEKQGFRYKVPR
jgi:Flp pilus assembly protein TadB